MKFYSKIIKKPEAIQFIGGVCETDDKKVIERLKEHPEKYRTDKPWPVKLEWKDTVEGKAMLARGKKLGIEIKNVRKEYLMKLIEEKEKKQGIANKVKAKVLGYQELIAKAKSLDIPTHKRKKEDILNDIEEKELILNA